MNINLNTFKTLIKSNLNLTILIDWLIGVTGLNFEKEYQIIKLLNKDSPMLIDIGAHKGESIKKLLKYKPKARIYAFEPNKKLAGKLKNLFKLYKNITIYDFAISKKKNISLFIPIINGYPFSGLSSVNKAFIEERLDNYFSFNYKKKISFKRINIKTITIDELSLLPDLIKIDAEGYEYEILKTAINTIKKTNPILIIEFNKNSFYRLNELLKNLGYIGTTYYHDNYQPNFKKLNLEKISKIENDSNLVNIVYIPKKSHLMLAY